MNYRETPLTGCFEIEMTPIHDARGYFMHTVCSSEFEERGLNPRLAQVSQSYNKKMGTLRGLHFQACPAAEDKLVRCIKGAIFDVVVDLRPGSPTFGRWHGAELSETINIQIYAPKGFAHGFQTLTDDCIVLYHIAQVYDPKASAGVRWDDPNIGVAWPLAPVNQSPRDLDLPLLPDLDRDILHSFFQPTDRQ